MRIIQDLLDLVAPHECVGCGSEGSLLCYDCRRELPAVPPRCYRCGRWNDNFRTCAACRRHTSIHSLWAVTQYEGAAKELIHSMKFARAQAAAATIAEALHNLGMPAATDTIVTYVPTANQRVRERGYDQSLLIAKGLARRLNCPLVPCLARTGEQRQVGKARAVRRQQMATAFRPVRPHLFHNKDILLVDDVLTTGATCEAAAALLRQAGARRVQAAVFAVA